jgi:outer membrane protein assembly factor BamB
MLAVFCWSVSNAPPILAEDWPQFRGPTGQGISTAKNLPVRWNSKSNVVWKTPLPGKGWSSPVVADGRVYLTTALQVQGTEAPISLRVQCVDAANGKLVWESEVFRPGPEETRAMHQKNSLASATPILSEDRLYVHFGHMGTAALDLSGKVVWRQTSLKYSPVHGNGGSPALIGDLLVFTCDGANDPFVVALDAPSGGVRWRTPRNTPSSRMFSFSTPLEIEVDGARQIVSAGSGLVGSYDNETGREIWRVLYGEGYSVVPRPVYAAGLLFICSGYDGPTLLAINPAGARGDITKSGVAWIFRKGVPLTPSPLAVGNELYWVSDNGIAKCLDARTGKVHWDERLDGEFSASPLYAEGRVYFQSEGGVGIVVKAGQTFELLSRNDLEERTLASYGVAEQSFIIRSESHLWRIGR